MKKNLAMRAGTGLLALTLITSCFVGGTFAKYTTSGKGEDSARVAKFGVTVTGTGNTFAKEYAADDSSYTAGVTVSSTENVVAPGTKGNMAAFTLSGTPEVAVKVSYAATEFDLGDNWTFKKVTAGEDGAEDTITDEYYCPLEIKVGSTVLNGNSYTSAALFEAAVKDAIAAHSETYAPGTDLSTKNADDKLAVSWAWAFESNNDEKDTQLGNNANATVSLEIAATVTQID